MVRCLFYIASCNLIKKVLSGQYSLRCVHGPDARFNKMVLLYPVESYIFTLFITRQSKHDGNIKAKQARREIFLFSTIQ